MPSDDASLESPERRPSARDGALLRELTGPIAVLHPGASVAGRRWAPEAFARVGDALAGDAAIHRLDIARPKTEDPWVAYAS